MNDVGVVAFLNPFVEKQRVEVIIDWDEKWPKKDPFANASFTLMSNAAGFTPVVLNKMLIPEIEEQLIADGLGTDYPNIDELAPGFVDLVATTISDSATIQAAFSAQALDEFKAPTARVLASPNYAADLQLWARTLSPMERAGLSVAAAGVSSPANPFLRVVQSLISAVGSGVEKDTATSAVQATGSTSSSEVDQVLRRPAAFRSLVLRAIDSKSSTMGALRQLEGQIRARTLQEQLAYAEALRRDGIYTRIRNKPVEAPMISSGTDAAAEKMAKQRADVRRLAADEPVLGAMFHAVRWFDMPRVEALDMLDGKKIWVEITNADPIDGVSVKFDPAWTLVARDGTRFVTVLRRDTNLNGGFDPSYLARSVQVRQIAPALSEAIEDIAESGNSDDMIVARLRKFIETRHSAVPVTITVPRRDKLTLDAIESATLINNSAEEPQGEAAHEINKEERPNEMRDAAESLRRHHPPHDAIGITWERDLTVRSIDGSLPKPDPHLHIGFKGYRIDVRETPDGKWQSLCNLDREAISTKGEEIFRTRLAREGFIPQPVQNCSSKRGQPATMLTIPADFVQWAGGSAVLGSPLDRLGQGLPANDDQHPLVALREQGTTAIQPRYGRTYEFRVRGVGLSGVGPAAGELQIAAAGIDSIDFFRGVPMDAPKADGKYFDLFRIPTKGKVDTNVQQESTPDVPLLVQGPHPRLQISTSLPIAHWRVALHSRGLTQAERVTNGGAEFERACARFVARSRDNMTRRQNGTIDPLSEKQCQFLRAVDPDCAGIEIVTRVWFPFSSNQVPGRHLVTGRFRRHRDDIEDACFSQLVARGETIVNDETYDDQFEVPVVDDFLPSDATEQKHPRILGGFHCVAEVAGYWSHHAKKLYDGEAGRRRWTRHFFAAFNSGRLIGGKIAGLDDSPFAAGEAPLVTANRRVEAQYAGLRDVEQERHLVAPNPPAIPTSGADCDAKSHGPVRVEAVRWRKFFFDRDCSDPEGAPCQPHLDTYRTFALAQIGPSIEVKDIPDNGEESIKNLKKSYANQLAVCLNRCLVTENNRSLVLPVFTFPDQTVYGEVVKLPLSSTPGAGVRSVIAKLGEFGSMRIAGIDVQNGGSDYDQAKPPDVLISNGGGTGAAAHVVIDPKSKTVKEVKIDNPGIGYTSPPTIEIKSQPGIPGSGATAEAKLIKRRLPWVDSDITWTVRMSWRVPMNDPHIERPLELSAVREFRLFRTDTRLDKCSPQPETERPVAVLSRPGRELLEDIDLDEVEWTWVDAVRDRELHNYVYRVVAIPEDTNTFAPQEWQRFSVNIPDSRIAVRPETIRMLPMVATDARRLGVYFSDPIVRGNADHVTYRIAKIADDPMLPVLPGAVTKTPVPAPYVPQTWEEVFPQTSVAVTPVDDWETLSKIRNGSDGIEAAPFEACDGHPAAEGRRGRIHIIASRVGKTDLVAPAKDDQPLGNPFFRLHLHTFDDKRLPALAHTAASDPAETEWLQFYPDDLSLDIGIDRIQVVKPWGQAGADSQNHVWYRYHFFAPTSELSSFHLSTFYSRSPELLIDATLRTALAKSWKEFAGRSSSGLRLFVEVEEGLAAETYAANDQLMVIPVKSLRFVTLRATARGTAIDVSLQ